MNGFSYVFDATKLAKKIHIRKESVRNLVGKFILHHGEKDKPINRTQRTGLDFLLMGGYAR
ncbi:hypothetical protein DXA74_13330 [Bacteroides sp. OF04-15BH]|nr:hypothetical protein DXA74_13330 [Bacteroides sp. OF04-15BH]